VLLWFGLACKATGVGLGVMALGFAGWLQLVLGQCVCFLGFAAPTQKQ
jgi:hypothetical protein